jgi:hypothetical protein
MPSVSRADAEALVDGLRFTCAPVLARFADKPEMLALAGELEETYNGILRANRDTLIEALLKRDENINAPLVLQRLPDGNPALEAFPPYTKVRHVDDTGAGFGNVWWPTDAQCKVAASIDPWTVAHRRGLTADPAPVANRPYVMVAWGNRPGALQVHYLEELQKAE